MATGEGMAGREPHHGAEPHSIMLHLPGSPLPSRASPREGAYQLLEEVAHGDIAVPLLHFRAQAVVELFVDLIDVLDLVENRLNLLEGENRLRRSSCGLQWLHRLPKEKGEH